ncbi:MAG: hypothetical protein E7270_09185 [Lachnospiraceae bacterium]|nr:hypothetical protein [Lachnospiraceae bacterium]
MIKKKIYVVSLILTVSMAFSACLTKKSENNADTSQSTTKETQETTTEEIDYNNPLNVNGYTYYGKENQVNSGEISLVAKIDKDATIGENSLSDLLIYKCNNENVVVQYVLSDKSNTEGEYLEENMEKSLYDMHLVGMNGKTHKVEKDILVGEDVSSYATRVIGGTWYTKENDGNKKMIRYNDEIEQEALIEVNDTNSLFFGCMTADGNKIYYDDGGWLYVYDVRDETTKKISMDDNIYVDFINGILTDDSDVDHILMTVMGGDLKEHNAIFNSATSKLEYMSNDESALSSIVNNAYIQTNMYNEDGDNYYIVAGSKGNVRKYKCNKSNQVANLRILDNGDLFFEYYSDGEMHVAVYDNETNELKGSTSYEAPMAEGNDVDEYSSVAYYIQNPIYIGEQELLLNVIDNVGNRLFYIWDMSKSEKLDIISMSEYEMPTDTIMEIDEEYDISLLRTGECSKEFMPLREIADEMEEKYGLDIFIEGESGKILDVYAIFPLSSYANVEKSLKYLDEELARYPKGFFEQFVYSGYKGIDIYISSRIILMDEEADNLDFAGGLHNTDGANNIVIAMDCGEDPSSIKQNIHHEMAHAIDQRIEYHMSDFNEKWNEKNPDDVYMYSYKDYESQVYDLGLDKYIYDYLYMDDRAKESYYLDNYSLTYPTEDRARIFENLMNVDSWYPDYNEMPLIKDKLNFYAECIRETFDTTGWENVEWERYLIDN